MNEQNNHAALTIAQQYPPAQYNLLVPMQTVTEIADIQKPVMNSVSISTNLNDGEIYEMEKAKDEWRDSKGYVHKATPAKYALTKKGLTKLMRAAGIKILSSRPVVPSTCQKCAEVNRSIGKPIRCGGCPNKDVKHEVRISVPQLTGENVTIVAHTANTRASSPNRRPTAMRCASGRSARPTRMLSAPSITDAPFPRTSKRKSGTFSARRRRRLRPSSTSSPPKEDRNGKELCM